jgi:pyruvate kinase
MRRAKIIATLGPASSTLGTVTALVESGLDVARINLSHGSHADHERSVALVRQAAEATGRAVGVLADLQGPKIRLGRFASGSVLLRPGAQFVITADDVPGDQEMVSTTHSGLANDVTVGDPILIDDGRVLLRVKEVSGPAVVTTVVEGGTLSDSKGINLPGAMVSVPAVSDKDVDDLRWALTIGVDLVALSFVRTAQDAQPVFDVMDDEGIHRPLIAKIERRSPTCPRSSTRSTGSWWLGATSESSCRSNRCRWCRSRLCPSPVRRASRSSSRPRCSSR